VKQLRAVSYAGDNVRWGVWLGRHLDRQSWFGGTPSSINMADWLV